MKRSQHEIEGHTARALRWSRENQAMALAAENARLKASNAELVTALRKCESWARLYKTSNGVGNSGPLAADLEQARAAIARATG